LMVTDPKGSVRMTAPAPSTKSPRVTATYRIW
jgi:hypothetical protein